MGESSGRCDACHAVFICYAMDKDTHSVTNAEVHEVFSQVRSLSWHLLSQLVNLICEA